MGRYVQCWWPPGDGTHEYSAYVPHGLDGWEPEVGSRVGYWVAKAEEDVADATELGSSRTAYGWAADAVMAQGESLSSSVIEGVHASFEGMAVVSMESSDAHNRAALGNWEMCEMALDMADSDDLFTIDDLLDLHSTLMKRTETPNLAGKIRTGPGWVGQKRLFGIGPLEAEFVPPPVEYTKPLLEDLIDYINFSEHTPVLKAAIAHAQFETIHPFPDGNGRTGRALIPIALFSGESGSAFHLPISRWLSVNRDEYYNVLRRTQSYEGTPDDQRRTECLEPWIELFSDAVIRSVEQVKEGVQLSQHMIQGWREQLGRVRNDSAVWRIASELAYTPVFTAESMSNSLYGEFTVTSVRRGINRLLKAGIIQEYNKTGKTRVYRANQIIELAEAVFGPSPGSSRTEIASHVDIRAAITPGLDPAGVPQTRSRNSGPGSVFAWRCGHLGKRSKKPCVRRFGHPGQHQY